MYNKNATLLCHNSELFISKNYSASDSSISVRHKQKYNTFNLTKKVSSTESGLADLAITRHTNILFSSEFFCCFCLKYTTEISFGL